MCVRLERLTLHQACSVILYLISTQAEVTAADADRHYITICDATVKYMDKTLEYLVGGIPDPLAF